MMQTKTGLAVAENITGPCVKRPENSLVSGHAASVWVRQRGVAAIGGEVDPRCAQRIRWSEDGVRFVQSGLFFNKWTGFFRPENFGDGVNKREVT